MVRYAGAVTHPTLVENLAAIIDDRMRVSAVSFLKTNIQN
jgi:hypothetical protein